MNQPTPDDLRSLVTATRVASRTTKALFAWTSWASFIAAIAEIRHACPATTRAGHNGPGVAPGHGTQGGPRSRRLLVALCLVSLAFLPGCSTPAHVQPASPGVQSCPPSMPQGNGGAAQRCQDVPAHCTCQEM